MSETRLLPNAGKIGIATVCLDRTSAGRLQEIAATVTALTVAGVFESYGVADREQSLVRALEKFELRVCLVDLDPNRSDAFRAVERLRWSLGESTAIFVSSQHTQPELIIAAMRAGATEYLVKPLHRDDVVDALLRLETKERDKKRSATTGKAIAFMGSKGGTGVTSLVAHLGTYLARSHQQKCLLIDQHSTLGDLSLYLGLNKHSYNFYELVNNTDRLDHELLQGFLLHHSSGVDVIDSPDSLDGSHQSSPEAIESTMDFLRGEYQYVLVDCSKTLSDCTIATLRHCDDLMLVVTADLPALRSAVRYMDALTQVDFPPSHIHVVLNRHSKKSAITDEQIEKAIRKRISFRVPNQYVDIARAINTGAPAQPDRRSELGVAFEQWAAFLKSDQQEEQEQQQAVMVAKANASAGSFGVDRLFAMKRATAK